MSYRSPLQQCEPPMGTVNTVATTLTLFTIRNAVTGALIQQTCQDETAVALISCRAAVLYPSTPIIASLHRQLPGVEPHLREQSMHQNQGIDVPARSIPCPR
jgi:hypothetical protein